MCFRQFDEVIASEEAAELVGDGFSEVAAAIVADYEAGEMPMPGAEDFTPAFKKWVKVSKQKLSKTPFVLNVEEGSIERISLSISAKVEARTHAFAECT